MWGSDRAPRWQRSLMTAVAVYEIAALWTDLPTITRVVHQYPKLAGVIAGGLVIHFVPPGNIIEDIVTAAEVDW